MIRSRRRHRPRRLLARLGIATSAVGALLALSVPLAGALSPSEPASCDPAHAVSAYHFTIDGRTAASLHGAVHQGDKVAAFFTIAHGCTGVAMALVAHTSPDPFFVPAHVSEQRVYDGVKAAFDAGQHSMGPVSVPPCDFQVDFAALGHGQVEGTTYSSATGGTNGCTPPPSTADCTSGGGVSVTLQPTLGAPTTAYTVAVTADFRTTVDDVTVARTPVTRSYAVGPTARGVRILVKDAAGNTLLDQSFAHACQAPVTTTTTTSTTAPPAVQATVSSTTPAEPAAPAAHVLGLQTTAGLPNTGSDTGLLLGLAFGLILTGVAITGASRRCGQA